VIVSDTAAAAGWSYHLFDPRAVEEDERLRLMAAYQCWYRVWSQTFRELDNSETLFSDDFSRQDEIGALFLDEACLGLSGFRWVDLSLPITRHDSYFRAWPAHVLAQVAATTPRVCVGSNLAVAPEWRGVRSPARVSEVLLTNAVRRFHNSDAQLMLGTMRNDKGMHVLSYRLGARPLARGLTFHNVNVDLIAFTRTGMAAFPPEPQPSHPH